MSAFRYHALNKTGSTIKGMIEADSERHARQLLREQTLIPTIIRPIKQLQTWNQHKLAIADLALLTRQLATLLAAGIPVEEALQGVCAQIEKASVRELLIGVRSKVLEGYALAQAMR